MDALRCCFKYFKHDLYFQHKVSEEQILRCKNDANVQDVMFDIAKQAVAQLDAVSVCFIPVHNVKQSC